MSRVLVVYYSLFGATERAALSLASATGADCVRLLPEKDYSFDYNTAVKEARTHVQKGYCPRLKNGELPLGDHDRIFVGSPNWFGKCAPPVLSYLRSQDLKGRTLIPFCTHGGGGLGQMEESLRAECKASKVLPGLALAGQDLDAQIAAWLARNPLGR